MSGLTTSSTSRVRRLIVAVTLLASLSAPSLLPPAALAYSLCDEPIVKDDTLWVVPLTDGDCSRFVGTLRPGSEILSDSSRAERFEVAMLDTTCLLATISSPDFTPDVYVYDDAAFGHEVGVWQRSGNQASSVVQLSSSARTFGFQVLYVLATSSGAGARFGKYTLDLRTC